VILLWGITEDAPMALVRQELQRRDAAIAFLDHSRILEYDVDAPVGLHTCGRIAGPYGVIRLAEIGAAYIRPHDFRSLRSMDGVRPRSREWRRAAMFDDILLGWSEITDALVLNRPSAMASNGSKPFQARLIEQAGFRVPATLLTTDPAAVRAFLAGKHAVVYKSASGVRSIVRRLTASRMRALDDVVWCPTQFQEWIDGTDFRVHVVGDSLFACRVLSAADDYRYGVAVIERADVPAEVAARCLRISSDLELPLAGIDLRLTPGGEWFCFEVNPSPAYSCFEEAADHRIAAAIADVLIAADRRRGHKESHRVDKAERIGLAGLA